ncbi:MAG TPA: lipase secretion chaperone [Rhizobacter sp.]
MIDLVKRFWLAGVAAVLLVAAVAYRAIEPAPEPADAPVAGAPPAAGPGGGAAVGGGSGEKGGPAPRDVVTLTNEMGLELDAARLFELGFAGGLVMDENTRSTVEALVNSMSDPPTEQEMAKLERTLREGLPREDAEKALKLVRDYRGYVHAVSQDMTPKGIPGSLAEAQRFFDEMDAVRRRYFDDKTAEALFGPHDRYARITMEASFIAQDATLPADVKKARLDALRAQLPADQRSLIPEPEAAEGAAASAPGS